MKDRDDQIRRNNTNHGGPMIRMTDTARATMLATGLLALAPVGTACRVPAPSKHRQGPLEWGTRISLLAGLPIPDFGLMIHSRRTI
jgi:hypothetical protein